MRKRGRPSKGMVLSKANIELAIKSTQSMGQAYRYMGVSRNTFKKYAKLHGLWKPTKNLKGIRRTGNVGSQLKHDLKQILEGKNPNPFREETLLTKGIREGYIPCQCQNCDADFSHIDSQKTLPPLILDFLDKNPMNTKLKTCEPCVLIVYMNWHRRKKAGIDIEKHQ